MARAWRLLLGNRWSPTAGECRATDHPATSTSRNNLAMAYQDAGRTAEAILLHEQALADNERATVK
jgi:hypothetical protein